MTRFTERLLANAGARQGRALAALLAAAALAGCGVTVNQAVNDAAHAAQAVTQLSEKEMRSWCPAAVGGGGRGLSQAQARDCLRRAWHGWVSELKRNAQGK